MWRKHWRIYQDHLKYIHNYIVKPFGVGILCYAERVWEMHDLAKHLPPPPSMKGDGYETYYWKVSNGELYIDDIIVPIKDGLPSSMHDELEDNQEGYFSLTR